MVKRIAMSLQTPTSCSHFLPSSTCLISLPIVPGDEARDVSSDQHNQASRLRLPPRLRPQDLCRHKPRRALLCPHRPLPLHPRCLLLMGRDMLDRHGPHRPPLRRLLRRRAQLLLPRQPRHQHPSRGRGRGVPRDASLCPGGQPPEHARHPLPWQVRTPARYIVCASPSALTCI